MRNKKIILIIVFIVVVILAIVICKNTNKEDTNNINNTNETEKNSMHGENIGESGRTNAEEEIVEYLNNVKIENKDISSTKNDETALAIEEKSKGTITKVSVEKIGDSSNLSVSDKTGWNSAIQVNTSSDITIDDVKVTTNGSGASGVVATGSNAVISISGSDITTENERSKGLLISNGGTIYANKLNITTSGLKSSAVATDFEGGLIEIKDSKIKCSGEKSAGVYATSTIKVEDTSIESENSEGAVIDGSGTIELTDVDITTYKKRAVMIYYTGPKVGETTQGTFTMTKGSLNVKGGQGFYVMNTKARINLEQVNMSITSGIFLKASVDEYGELGEEGGTVESLGGDAIVNCVKQTIKGDILVDSQSTVELNLTEKSKYTGTINNSNTGKEVTVKIDSNSKLTLTGDSYITTLENENTRNSNIDFNGYKLYVNGTVIN